MSSSSVLPSSFALTWLTSFLSCSVVVVDDLSSCSVVVIVVDDLSSRSVDVVVDDLSSCSVVVEDVAVDDLSSCSVVVEDDLSSSSGDGDARLEMCDRRVEYANTLPLSSRESTTIDANACAVLFTNFISPVAYCFWRKDRHSFRFCYRGVASSGNHTSMSQGEFRGYGCPTRIILQPEQANRIHLGHHLLLCIDSSTPCALNESSSSQALSALSFRGEFTYSPQKS